MLFKGIVSIVRLAVVVLVLAGTSDAGEKKLILPMRTDGPKSLDPVRGSTTYDAKACVQVYEQLLQYKYLVEPPALEPLLCTSMPTQSADRKSYTFELKPGVRFHDNACFPEGKGREITTEDVFFSIKRIVDPKYKYKSEWLVRESIRGLDKYKDEQKARVDAGEPFDYSAPVSGFEKIDDRNFTIHLTAPSQGFLWKLTMVQFSLVAREAVEHYGDDFGKNPVGTGPFTLQEWRPKVRLVFKKNPNYHLCTYPTEAGEYAKERGFDKPAGRRLPLVDLVEMPMFIEDQPLWLKFDVGELDYVQVPAEYFDTSFLKRSKKLRKSLRKKGITSHAVPLLDFIFRGFNMEDPIVGGYTDEKRALRQAICWAIDWVEFNDAFYNSTNCIYDGPIPPGLAGHPADHSCDAGYVRGPDLGKARELLAKAGYPDGKGLPVLDYWTGKGGNSHQQTELFARQLGAIGIKIKTHLVDFSTLIATIDKKQGQFFSFAWGSDYPDGENNLALFYGPNESPGSNHYNYKNSEYDALYERARIMNDSPERTKLYAQMRDIVLRDAPYCGSMARTRYYVVNPWLKNFKPNENFYNWIKYLDLAEGRPSK